VSIDQVKVEEIFKGCVADKVKKNQTLLKEIVMKMNSNEPNEGSPENHLNPLEPSTAQLAPGKSFSDPSADFRKAISKDLLEITKKLQKVRDQLAVREKN